MDCLQATSISVYGYCTWHLQSRHSILGGEFRRRALMHHTQLFKSASSPSGAAALLAKRISDMLSSAVLAYAGRNGEPSLVGTAVDCGSSLVSYYMRRCLLHISCSPESVALPVHILHCSVVPPRPCVRMQYKVVPRRVSRLCYGAYPLSCLSGLGLSGAVPFRALHSSSYTVPHIIPPSHDYHMPLRYNIMTCLCGPLFVIFPRRWY